MFKAIRFYGPPRVSLDRSVLFTESVKSTEGQLRLHHHPPVTLVCMLSLQQSQECLRCIGKMLVFAVNVEVRKLDVHSR